MTEPNSQQSTDASDMETARILDEFLQRVDAGVTVSREEFLKQHPDHADRLRECLDGLDLLAQEPRVTSLPPCFDDFEIHGVLGRGGMGVVYEATQKSLDRIVALKVMRLDLTDSKTIERFQREAETAAGLHHTNIVPVFATGREGNNSWYVMQRIEGESLAHQIKTAYRSEDPHPIPIEKIINVGIQAAEALDYAHKRDVIHRDVKPANLIVDKQGVVWLTDFGLARRIVDVGTTTTGALLGTPRYMSPEQAGATCTDVTHHTDIYSLGATLYELATGSPPFSGDEPLAVMAKIRNEEPTSIQTLRHDASRDLDIVLAKAMAKQPTHRYPSASAFADDLRAVGEGRPIRARTMSWIERSIRWTRRHDHLVRPIGIAVVTTIAAILLVLTLVSSSLKQTQGRFRIRAGGGPFAATIRDEHNGPPMFVTVPMQDAVTVKKGNYTMQLARSGRWSRTVRFHVEGGALREFSVRQKDGAKRELSIHESQAVPTNDFDAPSMLVFQGSTVRRLSTDSAKDWETHLHGIKADHVPLVPRSTSNDETAADDPVFSNVDFGYEQNSFTPWCERTLEGGPRPATPVRALESAIDLDGDKRADSIIVSIGDSAMLALDADGKRLWCKRYVFPKPAAPAPDEWSQNLVLPGVLDMQTVEDQNHDGVADVVAQIIRIQPAVQNDVCVALLSGKTGDLITAIHRPPIIVANHARWPLAGLLLVHDRRTRRSPLIFNTRLLQDVFRPVFSQQKSVVYQAKLLNTSFALPLPLKTLSVKGRCFAVQCIGDETTVFELSNGKQFGRSTTKATCYHTPTIARLDADRLLVMLTRNDETERDFLRVQQLNGEAVWTKELDGIERKHNSNLKFAPSWPIVVDLNRDGDDEVIAPVDFEPFVGMGVQAYRLVDGMPLWPNDVRQLACVADGWVERMVATADVDGDGWRDIATVTIAGKARPVKLGAETGDSGDAFVYVDWLSGENGRPLCWARHPIPIVSDRVEVCEVDAVRSDLKYGDRGMVEVELVTGESREEGRLECMTIRFLPNKRQAIMVANGLTVCENSTRLSQQRPRWYRRRPGTFGLEDERLVLLDEPNTTLQRLGENQIIASWNRSDPLLAVKASKPNRISVISAKDLTTRWSCQALPGEAKFRIIRFDDDSIDLLAPTKQEGKPIHVNRMDGLTGRPVWSRPMRIHGRPILAQFIPNSRGDTILVVDDGRNVKHGDRDAFHMSLFQAGTGKLVWDRPFLDQASSRYHGKGLRDFATVDVNGDQIPDICGPDQNMSDRPNPVLGMTMWDGRNGEILWTRSWGHDGFLSGYEPMWWNLLRLDEKPYMVFVEPTTDSNDNREIPASIVLCDASSGQVVAKIATEYLMHPWLRYGPGIVNITVDPHKPRLATWLRDDTLAPQLVTYDVSLDGISRHKHHETGCRRFSACWFLDVTGDDVPEALAAVDNTLSCFAMSGKLLWSTPLRDRGGRNRYFSWNQLDAPSDFGAIWQNDGSKQLVAQWIDLHSGKELNRLAGGADVSTDDSTLGDLPPVAVPSASKDGHKQDEPIFIASSKDGVFLASESQQDVGTSLTKSVDPRRIKRLPIYLLQYGDSLQGFLLSQIKRLLIAFALLALPMAYVFRVIRSRRWSLRSFLLAPAITMFFLVAWKSVMDINGRADFVAILNGVLLLVAIYGIVATLRATRFGFLFVVIIAGVLVLVVLFLMNLDDNLPFRYVVDSRDALLLILVMLFVAGQGLGVFHAVCCPLFRMVGRFVSRCRVQQLPTNHQLQ